MLRRSPRGKHGFITRVGLFNFGAYRDQTKLVEDFESTCRKRRHHGAQQPGIFAVEFHLCNRVQRHVEDVESSLARSRRALDRAYASHSHDPLPHVRRKAAAATPDTPMT